MSESLAKRPSIGRRDALIRGAVVGLAVGLVLTASAVRVSRPRKRLVAVVAFAPDGRSLVTASHGFQDEPTGLIEFWDVATGRRKSSTPCSKRIFALAYTPDGRRIATGGDDGVVTFRDALTGQAEITFEGRLGTSYSLALTRDGRSLAVGGEDGVSVWDVATRRERWRAKLSQAVRSVSISHDGRWLATGDGGTAILWDLATGERLPRASLANRWEPVVFAPDRNVLASKLTDLNRAKYTFPVSLTDLDDDQALVVLDTMSTNCLAFSPDGRFVAAGGNDETVTIWEVASGRLISRFEGHRSDVVTDWVRGRFQSAGGLINPISNGVVSVAFSPDGHSVVSGARDGTAQVWDPATGKRRLVIQPGSSNHAAWLIAAPVLVSLLCGAVLVRLMQGRGSHHPRRITTS